MRSPARPPLRAAPPAPLRRLLQLPEIRATPVAVAGAALLALVGRRLSAAQVGTGCDGWPALPAGLAYGLLYLTAMLLLTYAWLQLSRGASRLRLVLAGGALVHLTAWSCPPFLMTDTPLYAALGRAVGRYGADAATPLAAALPPGDPFLALVPPLYRGVGTSYGRGFVWVAALIDRVAGEDLGLHLRLFQLLALGAILGAALLTARAVRNLRARPGGAPPLVDEPRAAALVLFAPLSLFEATVNAHLDAALCLFMALALWLYSRRPGLVWLGFLPAALVKATGLLPLGFLLLGRGLRASPVALGRRSALWLGAIGGAGAIGALVALDRSGQHPAATKLLWELVGSPGDPFLHCTRALECIPRGVLHHLLGRPREAWLLGLLCRVGAATWLFYAAWRASLERSPLRWLGTALFFFFLLLQGWLQSWYLLLLLPLLPFCSPRLYPAARTLCATAALYYAIRLPLQCELTPWVVAVKEIVEGCLVVLPALWVWRRGRPA